MSAKTATLRGKAKILIIDDHALFREGLSRILGRERDMEVCGEAADAPDALRRLSGLGPDLAIVDISLEGMNGIDLTKQLRARRPDLRILVLSMHKESIYADRALRAGANGYIMKREGAAELLEAVRRVLQGHVHVSQEVADAMLQKAPAAKGGPGETSIDHLSDRELEIFRMIGDGYGTRQIADELKLSIKTVETHREHIREKMHLGSTFDLVQRAIHWVHHEAAAS
jgi:DNA-binding NarL/FixJ family response regulator